MTATMSKPFCPDPSASGYRVRHMSSTEVARGAIGAGSGKHGDQLSCLRGFSRDGNRCLDVSATVSANVSLERLGVGRCGCRHVNDGVAIDSRSKCHILSPEHNVRCVGISKHEENHL